uniref:Uncharacterized protein n=1 Tax=Anguilla anguilla TaxID=7936 RepID=A0A0E9Q4G8_ANGAN
MHSLNPARYLLRTSCVGCQSSSHLHALQVPQVFYCHLQDIVLSPAL